MNRELVRTATLFIALLALQVAVLDNIKIGGYITPYLYVLFLMLFPFSYGSFSFMMTAFFLGLAVDTFEFTGGLHAMACVAVAFVRRWSVTTFLGIPRKEIYAYRPLDGKNLGTASVLLFFALVFLRGDEPQRCVFSRMERVFERAGNVCRIGNSGFLYQRAFGPYVTRRQE